MTVEQSIKLKGSIGKPKVWSVDPEIKIRLSKKTYTVDTKPSDPRGYVPFIKPPDPLRGQNPEGNP